MHDDTTLKVCTGCLLAKAADEFHRNAKAADGMACRCKACRSAYRRNYYQSNRAKEDANTRRYYREEHDRVLARRRARHAEAPEVKRRQDAAYRARHPELMRERDREYRRRAGEELLALRRARYRARRNALGAPPRQRRPNESEARRRYHKEWRDRNPHKVRALAYIRNARKRNAPGTCSSEQLAGRWELFGGLCWMCGKPATSTDHVIPLSRGGSNWPANLRPACKPCNSFKRERMPWLFLLLLSRLYPTPV